MPRAYGPFGRLVNFARLGLTVKRLRGQERYGAAIPADKLCLPEQGQPFNHFRMLG